jgi:Outer membrane protein beta-barrel domain
MKKVLLIAVIFFATNSIIAQTPRIGFTAGAAFANLKGKADGETETGNSKAGLTAGILVDLPLSKNFSFQPALNFVQKGSKDEETFGGTTEKTVITMNCIELPLNFLYNASGSKGNFFIGAGPSVSFYISGKGKFDDGTDSYSEDIEFGNNEDEDDFKGMEFAANFLTGYRFSNGLQISGHYNAGLSNLLIGESADGTVKSHYFGIKIGVLLGNKK